ncbi:MAG TPA: hypothetical protein VLC48_07875, partial [Gemmatimonadota bacterium]|nr:hypothetical protein [Gemmatimonadota bacterium]
WIRDGGVVVAMGGASGYFVDAEITSARLVGEDEDDDDDADQERQVGLAQAAYSGGVITGGTEDAPIRVPGAIMRATLDLTHPLTFGYENQALAVLVSGDDFYHPSKEGANPVAFVGDDLRIAGYEWPDNTEEFLQNTAWMVDEPIGSGRLILFADEPTFRLLWKSLDRLFLNGILFGPTIR